jgi:hypothetical protein
MKWTVLAAAVIMSTATAVHSQNSALRRKIESSYRAESRALARENAAGVLNYYAKDYVYQGARGEQYRTPQLQAILARMFASMSGIQSTTRILGIARAGTQLRARVREQLEATLQRKSGKKARLIIKEDRNDYWRPAGGSWVKSRSRSLSQSETLNGQPISPLPTRKGK